MLDKYNSFEELAKSEKGNYTIECVDRNCDVVIVAPHGGNCEPKTTEIAKGIAGEKYSFYTFSIDKGKGENKDLHITSHKFDEPKCLELVGKSQMVITIHGCQDSHSTAKEQKEIFIGGLDAKLNNGLKKVLEKEGFCISSIDDFAEKERLNICNRGRTNQGLQFELTKSFRDDKELRERFIEVVSEFLE